MKNNSASGFDLVQTWKSTVRSCLDEIAKVLRAIVEDAEETHLVLLEPLRERAYTDLSAPVNLLRGWGDEGESSPVTDEIEEAVSQFVRDLVRLSHQTEGLTAAERRVKACELLPQCESLLALFSADQKHARQLALA